MKCRFCSSDMEKSWKFCPKCGAVQRSASFENLDQIVNKMMKEMKSMDRVFDRQADVFDTSPLFRNLGKDTFKIKFGPKSSGFTVRISRSGDKQPSVSVRTFGNVDREKLMKRMQNKFDIKPKTIKSVESSVQEEKRLKIPNHTEEPRSVIKRMTHKVIVDVELPRVKSIKDIIVNDLENSVEIKAVSKDHGYFKILTKPANFNLTKTEFKDGILRLEFS